MCTVDQEGKQQVTTSVIFLWKLFPWRRAEHARQTVVRPPLYDVPLQSYQMTCALVYPCHDIAWIEEVSRKLGVKKLFTGGDYSKLLQLLLLQYTNRRDIGISNKTTFCLKYEFPKMVNQKKLRIFKKLLN